MGILVHTIILLSLGVVCLGQVRHHHKLVHKHRSLPPPEYDPNHPKLDKIKVAYLDMPVDHFNGSDKRTFRNKYFMNFDFFESGGPAFLYFPGEAPATDGFIQSVGGTQLTTIARNMIKHAGAAFVLEHRYFGESIPVDNAHTTAGMKYLTSQQYLADAAYFIKYANTKFNLAVNGTKWLTIGGSYSGSLSAWMRLLYPDVVVGAVSNSGPVLAVENYEDYFGTVGINLKKQSQECFDETRAAFEHVLAHVDKYEEYQKLREELQLCHDMPPGDPHQVVTLVDILNGPFCTTSQYGGNNRGQYGAQNIPTLCDIMTNDTTVPYARRLRNLIQWSTPLDKWNCVDNSHLEQLATLREVMIFCQTFLRGNYSRFKGRNYLNRMWNWLCCNEFGYFMTTTSANQPFGDYGKFVNVQHLMQVCEEVFGYTPEHVRANIRATNEFYGGNKHYNVKFGTEW